MKILYRIMQFLMIDHTFALVFILVADMEGTSDEMTMILLALAPSFLVLAVATVVIRSVLHCPCCCRKNGARALSNRSFMEEKP